MKKNKMILMTGTLLLTFLLGSCSAFSEKGKIPSDIDPKESADHTEYELNTEVTRTEEKESEKNESKQNESVQNEPAQNEPGEEESEPETTEKMTENETEEVDASTGIYYDQGGLLIAIDPGHQAKGDSAQEPVGPGASETKPKVSSGTSGVSTGIPEHELNLAVSLYLRDELLKRGYSVLMIRETPDVNISNALRAELANQYHADAFIRIHANSASDPEVHGALTMCMTSHNPYHPDLYKQSRSLSEHVLSSLCEASGISDRGILESDSMSGINWSSVPVTIVETGFMSNPEEDEKMATDSFRREIAGGIADGIDQYFGK